MATDKFEIGETDEGSTIGGDYRGGGINIRRSESIRYNSVPGRMEFCERQKVVHDNRQFNVDLSRWQVQFVDVSTASATAGEIKKSRRPNVFTEKVASPA